MNLIKIIEQEEILKLKKNIPNFCVGDEISVNLKIKEGNRKRIQSFEGIVISKKNRSLNSNFIVKKNSHNVYVERTFALYSPLIYSIIIKKHVKINRSKLYYLRYNSKKNKFFKKLK